MWFEGKWMQLEDILSKVAKFRKIKAACFLSYVGDRHNTNTRNIVKYLLRGGKRRKLRR
jgi:hypothetical protein